ncbi:aspartyl protease family protein [Sphingomonas flavescens]|uniref:aspartyl protease family protein n=1 Tax=Sphingomonas flavescens TaxID=3132797 RepID=UPI002805EB0D|nr:aspartyl protease family protein [Sphingomonas limnosediminicola]
MQKRRWVLAMAAGMSAPLSAQTTTTTLDSVAGVPVIDKTTQTEDIRFKSRDSRMTVPVRLSGAGPYQFLVDTGADRSAVSTDLVSKLNLRTEGGTQLHSLSGISEVKTARISDVHLTRRPERSVDAAVLSGANMGADGIVGVDLLRSQRVQFDFEKQTMSIVPSTTPEFVRGPDTIVIEARRKNGRLIVTDAYANSQPLTVVVDTGSQVSIGNQALRAKLLRNNLVDVAHEVELESVTGQKIIGEYMIVRKLEIGGLNLTNLAIVFADAHTFKQLKLNDRPALLLGMNAIRAFKRVSIDFANKKFRVMLPEESALDVRFAAAGQP